MSSSSFAVALTVLAVAHASSIGLPVAHFAAPYAAPYAAGPVVAGRLLVPAGSGLEGQYVPDNLERLYDDGSYRPQAHPIPLSASPVGLVPSGSGLEGAYVHDNTEHLFDDGSYRGELIPTPLAASPYGLVPAGSGLEGQYVHDFTERLTDDGSYKPGVYH